MSSILQIKLARVRIAEVLTQALLRKGRVGIYDYNTISTNVERASPIEKFLLKKCLKELIAAQKEIIIPKGYFDFLDKVNVSAFGTFIKEPIVQEMLDAWKEVTSNYINDTSGKTKKNIFEKDTLGRPIITQATRDALDNAGLTYNKNIECMNLCSSLFHDAWHNELGLTAHHEVMVVEACTDNDKTPKNEFHYSINKSPPSYRVGRWGEQHVDLPRLWSIAVHEPEHYHQALCAKVVRKCCTDHKKAIETASIIFQNKCISYPPSVFNGAKDEKITELGLQAYLTRPKEVTAYYAQNLMELALSKAIKMTPRQAFRCG